MALPLIHENSFLTSDLNTLVHHSLDACFECRHPEATHWAIPHADLESDDDSVVQLNNIGPSVQAKKVFRNSSAQISILDFTIVATLDEQRSPLVESAQRSLPAVFLLPSGTSSVPPHHTATHQSHSHPPWEV